MWNPYICICACIRNPFILSAKYVRRINKCGRFNGKHVFRLFQVCVDHSNTNVWNGFPNVRCCARDSMNVGGPPGVSFMKTLIVYLREKERTSRTPRMWYSGERFEWLQSHVYHWCIPLMHFATLFLLWTLVSACEIKLKTLSKVDVIYWVGFIIKIVVWESIRLCFLSVYPIVS